MKVLLASVFAWLVSTGPAFSQTQDMGQGQRPYEARTTIGLRVFIGRAETEGGGFVHLVEPRSYPITSDLTVPDGVKLQFHPGASLSGSATVTFSDVSQIIAPTDQAVFGSSLTVTISRGGVVHPEWWGAVVDDATDDAEAIVSAIASVSSAIGLVVLNPGVYNISEDVTVPVGASLDFLPGAIIDGAFTLTLDQGSRQFYSDPKRRIFGTSLSVVYGSQLGHVRPEWYGADPTGSVNAATAMQAAVDDIRTASAIDVNTNRAPTLMLQANAQYSITNAGLWLGADESDPSRAGVKSIRTDQDGAYAEIHCQGTGVICLDWTGVDIKTAQDLWIEGGAVAPAIGLLLARRTNEESAGRATFHNIQMRGTFTDFGVYNYASEGTAWLNSWIRVTAPVVMAISKDNSTHSVTIPHADMTLASESNIEYHFYNTALENRTAAASGAVSVLDLLSVRNVSIISSYFHDVGDDIPFVRILDEEGVQGSREVAIRDSLFHQAYDIGVQLGGGVGALIDQVTIEGNQWGSAVGTADIVCLAGVQASNLTINGARSIDCSSTNSDILDSSRITLPTSTSSLLVDRAVEGLVMFPAGATLTFDQPTNRWLRARFIETDTGRAYSGWDNISNVNISTIGIGEDNLRQYTIAATAMSATNDSLVVEAAGTKTGGAGNKTIKLHLGSTSWTVHPAANNTDDWILRARIDFLTAATQRVIWTLTGPTGVVASGYETATEDNAAGAQILKITGECADAGDTITQTMWSVKRAN